MTQQTRSVNKARFEQGDTPQGSDYVDLIDSYMSLADTTAQSLSSPLSVAGALSVTTAISAASLEISGTVSANAVNAVTVSASTASFDTLFVGGNEVLAAPGTQSGNGEIFLTATAASVASAAGAYSIIPGAFSAVSTFQVQTSASPTLCEIEYLGTVTAIFFAAGRISIKASANNKLASFRIGVNASGKPRTQQDRFVASTTDVGNAVCGGNVELKPNDKVSLMFTNQTDTVGFGMSKVLFNIAERN